MKFNKTCIFSLQVSEAAFVYAAMCSETPVYTQFSHSNRSLFRWPDKAPSGVKYGSDNGQGKELLKWRTIGRVKLNVSFSDTSKANRLLTVLIGRFNCGSDYKEEKKLKFKFAQQPRF